jgi:hypothetical protein
LLEDGRNVFSGEINVTLDNYLKNKLSITGYIANSVSKENYFRSIETLNEKFELTDTFYFSKKIILKLCSVITNVTSDTQIGVAMLDKYNSTVFTLQKELIEFSNNIVNTKIEIPSAILSPGIYNFRLAIWTKSGSVYEVIDGFNQITIMPDEGISDYNPLIDYGVLILNAKWEDEIKSL